MIIIVIYIKKLINKIKISKINLWKKILYKVIYIKKLINNIKISKKKKIKFNINIIYYKIQFNPKKIVQVLLNSIAHMLKLKVKEFTKIYQSNKIQKKIYIKYNL